MKPVDKKILVSILFFICSLIIAFTILDYSDQVAFVENTKYRLIDNKVLFPTKTEERKNNGRKLVAYTIMDGDVYKIDEYGTSKSFSHESLDGLHRDYGRIREIVTFNISPDGKHVLISAFDSSYILFFFVADYMFDDIRYIAHGSHAEWSNTGKYVTVITGPTEIALKAYVKIYRIADDKLFGVYIRSSCFGTYENVSWIGDDESLNFVFSGIDCALVNKDFAKDNSGNVPIYMFSKHVNINDILSSENQIYDI